MRTRDRQSDPFDSITRLPMREQIAALDEGLAHGSGEEAQRCALRLIEIAGFRATRWTRQTSGVLDLITGLSEAWRSRHAEAALRVLIRRWGAIRADLRAPALALGRRPWVLGVQALAQGASRDERLVALAIARDTCDPRLGVFACGMLADPDREVRARADQVVTHQALRLARSTPSEHLGGELARLRARPATPIPCDPSVLELERCALLDAIADAAWSFATHRCRSPLLACALLAEEPPEHPAGANACERLRRLLGERNHPSHAPLRAVVRRTPAPFLRRAALRWARLEAMRDTARERLESADSTLEHEIVLSDMHLALDPARARTIRALRVARRRADGGGAIPDAQGRAALSDRARAGLVEFAGMLAVDDATRAAIIEPALSDPAPLVRLTGCAASEPAERVDYIYDPDERIARHAALLWSTLGVAAPAPTRASCERRTVLAATARRSPHAWVRRVAEEEHARLRTGDPASPASRLQARRFMESDPARFARAVRETLHDPERRLDALGLIIALRVEGRFARDLAALARGADVDPRARATAVRGLDAVTTAEARDAARACAGEQDPRLRSNAIETRHVPIESLVEFKDDEHHRVRSSALRRMLMPAQRSPSPAQAVDALVNMLRDERAPHRDAAVWAAQRTVERRLYGRAEPVLDPILTSLGTIAREDPETRVRRRASRCLRRVRSSGAAPTGGAA